MKIIEKIKDCIDNIINNVYPQTTLTYIDSTTNVIICNGESFNRVYRYIGEK